MKKVFNVLKQLLNLKRFPVLLGKIISRVRDGGKEQVSTEYCAWLAKHEEDFAQIAESLDADLWQESLDYAKHLETYSTKVLSNLDVKLGGGGFYTLIYFLTRYQKPNTVVETGVAAGFSSHAFLSAMKENQKGELFSSDFPYFRISEPEKYIGILVPEELKAPWRLYIDGDSVNLPKITQQVSQIDLFHYDSDKRYAGRETAMKFVEPKLSDSSIIVMDDINDNQYFMDYCMASKKPYRIFKFHGKHIGLIGKLN